MATSPLERAIQALTDALRVAQHGFAGTSPVTGAPSQDQGSFASGVVGIFGALSPRMTMFSREIQRATESMRQAREQATIGRNIAAASSLGDAGIRNLLNISRSQFLRPREQQFLQDAANEARRTRDEAIRAARQLAVARRANPANPQFAANLARAQRAAHRTRVASQAAQTAARAAAGGAASAISGRAAIAGSAAGVANVATVPILFIYELNRSIIACREFSERVNQSNRALAQYSGGIAVAFTQLGIGDIRRGIGMGMRTEATTVELAKAINSMRDSWFNFDANMKNIENRLAIAASQFTGGFGGLYGGISGKLERLLEKLGVGEKDSELSKWLEGFGIAFEDNLRDLKFNIQHMFDNAARQAAGQPPLRPPPPPVRPALAVGPADANLFGQLMGEKFFPAGAAVRGRPRGAGEGMERNK